MTVTETQVSASAVEKSSLTHEFLDGLLGYALRRATNTAMSDFAAAMNGTGLRPGLASILSIVEENPGVRQGVVAGALNIARANMAPLVAELEELGLIRRLPHATDKRAVAIDLTAKGAAAICAAKQKIMAHERRTFERLTEKERARLLELLRKI
jgi:DNA-binding MarR family transcriptional regulator